MTPKALSCYNTKYVQCFTCSGEGISKSSGLLVRKQKPEMTIEIRGFFSWLRGVGRAEDATRGAGRVEVTSVWVFFSKTSDALPIPYYFYQVSVPSRVDFNSFTLSNKNILIFFPSSKLFSSSTSENGSSRLQK